MSRKKELGQFIDVKKTTYKVSYPVAEFFYKINRMAAFRLYLYVNTINNNHLHTTDYESISADLGTSIRSIKKCIKVLLDHGIAEKISDNYIRIKSARRLPQFRVYNKHGEAQRTRLMRVYVSFEDILDLSKLRSVFFYTKVKSAHNRVLKNAIESGKPKRSRIEKRGNPYLLDSQEGKDASIDKVNDQHDPVTPCPLAAGYIKKTTRLDVTEATISRQIKKCHNMGWLISRGSTRCIAKYEAFDEAIIHANQVGKGLFVKGVDGLYEVHKMKPKNISFHSDDFSVIA